MASVPQPELDINKIRCCLRCRHWNRLPTREHMPEGICHIEEVKDYNKSILRPVTTPEDSCPGFKPRFQVYVSDKLGNSAEEKKAL